MRYPRLFVTRGLPGSGKTTVARELVQSATEFAAGEPVKILMVRINRDDIRRMFNGRRLGLGQQEQVVTAAQDASIIEALKLGLDVVVDDTNLRDSDIRRFRRLADTSGTGAEVHVIDLRDVALTECIRRDALRQGAECVGEAVIRKMHAEHIAKPGTTTMTLAAAASARATR